MKEYGNGHCAACGCRVRVGVLMCSAHWRMVSKGTQRDVWLALDRWNAGDGTLGDLRDAQERAIRETVNV